LDAEVQAAEKKRKTEKTLKTSQNGIEQAITKYPFEHMHMGNAIK
jgi:hypothetical protein